VQRFDIREKIPTWGGKDFWLLIPVYFFISGIQLKLKLDATPAWFDGTLARNHQLLVSFQYVNNEQSRLLQYLIPDLWVKLTHMTVSHAYMTQRFVFVALAFVVFYAYLRRWFTAGESFAGTCFLAAVMPLTYAVDLQESGPLLMLLFVMGLWAIRENKTILFTLILWIGAFTNETILILPAVYFFYQVRLPARANLQTFKLLGVWVKKTLFISILPMATAGLMRYITRDRPHLGDAILWNQNWSRLGQALTQTHLFDLYRSPYLYFILVFSVFWLYALLGYRRSGLFLQRALWMVPLFLLAHFITGKIDESRQMIPLGFILIPMGLSFVFSKNLEPPDHGALATNLASVTPPPWSA
jgi:hypothetical protein